MYIRKLLFVFILLAALLTPQAAQASSHGAVVNCQLPESNADGLEILSNYYPGYWWDHADITVAVQAHPKAKKAQLKAIHAAIATWSKTLNDCFGGRITLTDVTSTANNPQKADIVVHYVLRAGGVVFAGYAVCGDHGCPISSSVLISRPARTRPRIAPNIWDG